jgi:hypothetical protein
VDVLLEPTLIGQRQPGPTSRDGLRDCPRNRALIGHTNNEAVFAGEISHMGLKVSDSDESTEADGA